MTLKKINEIFGEIFKRSETRTKYDHNTGWNQVQFVKKIMDFQGDLGEVDTWNEWLCYPLQMR